jgi:NAD(P)H-dependent FMN reductase
VIATPVYKTAYSGLLKSWLDPQTVAQVRAQPAA